MMDSKADDRTPEEAGARLAAIRKLITVLDAQADTYVAAIIDAKASLAGLAAQRQPLVDELDQIIREMTAAPWRDVLRASGESTVP